MHRFNGGVEIGKHFYHRIISPMKRLFIIGFICIFLWLIATLKTEAVDPPEIVYAYKNKEELLIKAKQGDLAAQDKLNFAYDFTKDDSFDWKH